MPSVVSYLNRKPVLVGRPGGGTHVGAGERRSSRSALDTDKYVPRLTGTLYFQVQARLHSLISRRYFARVGRETQWKLLSLVRPARSGLLATPVKASIARPLIEALRNETVAKDERIRELLPSELTPFDVAVRAALGG
jgi:hypothetical protein